MQGASEFVEFDLFTKQNIKRNKEILKNTFLIDFDKIDIFNSEILNLDYSKFISDIGEYKEIINDIVTIRRYEEKKYKIKYEKWKKNKVKKFFEELKDMNDTKEMLLKIHKITIEIMGCYSLKSEDYLCFNNYIDFEPYLEQYLFDNIQNNLIFFRENDKSEYINQLDSIVKYENISNDEDLKKVKRRRNKNTYNSSSNMSRKKKAFYKEINSWKKGIKKVCTNDTGLINNYFSNSYLYIIEEFRKNKLLNIQVKEDGGLKIAPQRDLKNLQIYIKKFMNKDIEYSDLYCFERLNNILNIFYITHWMHSKNFFIRFESLDNILDFISEVIYLPNIFNNINFLNQLYNLKYTYESELSEDEIICFMKSVYRLCCDLNYYLIPLYNMIFSNILNEYNKVTEASLKTIAKEILSTVPLESIKTKFNNLITDNEKNDKDNFKYFNNFVCSVSYQLNNKLDLTMIRRKNIITQSINFNNELSKIYIKEKDTYKENLKKLLISMY